MLNSQIGGDLIIQILAEKKSKHTMYLAINSTFSTAEPCYNKVPWDREMSWYIKTWLHQGCKNNKLLYIKKKNHTLEKLKHLVMTGILFIRLKYNKVYVECLFASCSVVSNLAIKKAIPTNVHWAMSCG